MSDQLRDSQKNEWELWRAENRKRANWEYIAANRRNLRRCWDQLLESLTVDSKGMAASRWYTNLKANYESADRHYHNLDHVGQVLSWIEYGWEGNWETCLIAKYAAWFHDVIYDSKARDNEEKSAETALAACEELGVTPETARIAADWILRTKGHNAGGSRDCAQFLDCDLAILSAPWELYAHYAAAIRREYGWVEEAAYRAGRRRVLEGFLGRERIFLTDAMARELEGQARRNLQQEIELLASKNG